MATLNTFGFTPRKARSSSQQKLPAKLLDRNPSAAFCQPIDIKPVLASPHNNNNNNNNKNHNNTQTRKTSNVKVKRKGYTHANSANNSKITQYFNTTTTTSTPMEVDNDNEEEELTCIIREKVPFWTLFGEIEKDYVQEFIALDEEIEKEVYSIRKRSKCKRTIQFEEEENSSPMVFKRQKITLDTDLSSVMSRFLNIKSNIILTSAPQMRIECLNEYKSEEEDDKEDLRRYLRHKMSKEESSLFVLQITQEYLS